MKHRETKRETGREREEIYREVRGERGALESGAGVGEGGAAVPCPLWGAAGSGLHGVAGCWQEEELGSGGCRSAGGG